MPSHLVLIPAFVHTYIKHLKRLQRLLNSLELLHICKAQCLTYPVVISTDKQPWTRSTETENWRCAWPWRIRTRWKTSHFHLLYPGLYFTHISFHLNPPPPPPPLKKKKEKKKHQFPHPVVLTIQDNYVNKVASIHVFNMLEVFFYFWCDIFNRCFFLSKRRTKLNFLEQCLIG